MSVLKDGAAWIFHNNVVDLGQGFGLTLQETALTSVSTYRILNEWLLAVVVVQITSDITLMQNVASLAYCSQHKV